jgi:hypothetical protein
MEALGAEMTEDDFDKLFADPMVAHPFLPVAWAAIQLASYHLTGIAEIKSMDNLKSPQYLRQQWANQGLYEGGIDYERPEPPSGADGLVVVEFKEPSSP